MNIQRLVGILVIAGAYGLTWYLMLRSMGIVKMIDREGLNRAGEIKARFRGRGATERPGDPGSSDSGQE